VFVPDPGTTAKRVPYAATVLFLVRAEVQGTVEPTVEFLDASKRTLELLSEWQRSGKVRGGGVYVGPQGMCFVLDVADDDELHTSVAGLPAYRFARFEVTPLIPFHRDVELSLDEALAHARRPADED
jgi:muconolactone delta-isomerase